MLWLQGIRESAGVPLENAMAFISDSVGYFLLVLCLLYCSLNKQKFLRALFCYGISTTINAFVKITACVYRPWIREPKIHTAKKAVKTATGYSFPSGHTAACSSSAFGIIKQYKEKRLLVVLLSLFVLLVAFSRNYLGCHTPQDVLVALLESLVGLAAAELLVDYLEKHDDKDFLFFIASTIFFALLFAYIFVKPYPIDKDAAGNILVRPDVMQRDAAFDFAFGLALCQGWFFEKRLVKFSTENLNAKKIILRVFVVALLAFLVNFVLYPQTKLFLDRRLAKFIRGYLFAMGAVFIGPLIFTKIERALKW